MIQVENIHKYFGSLHVLRGITLSVEKGKILSIIGRSGAGKTTLLQIIGTLQHPDKGRVIIDGVDVFGLSNSKLSSFRNQKIGFVFQFHHLLPEFTALENVCIPGYLAHRKEAEVIKRGKELLDILGLSDRMNHKPAQLSGGEQQRVAVARAIINNPAAILADEPSGNLDTANKQELHKLFLNLRDEFNQTFIIATHDEQLAALADDIIRIKDGMIIQ